MEVISSVLWYHIYWNETVYNEGDLREGKTKII